MPRPKMNVKLILLAVIGVMLYFTAGSISLGGDQGDTGNALGQPAVTRDQASRAAAGFAGQNEPNFQPSDTAVYYQSHKTMSGYLQKNDLLKPYTDRYGGRYPLDYWQVELHDRAADVRYIVYVGMTKPNIVGWKRTPAAEGPPVSGAVLRELLQRHGYDPDEWIDISEAEQVQAGVRTFEQKTPLVGGAKLHLETEAADGRLLSLVPSFVVPASYVEWLAKQDRSSSIMYWISVAASLGLTVAALVYAILYRKHISFRRGILLTIVFGVLFLLNNLNTLPVIHLQPDVNPGDETFMVAVTVVILIVITLITTGGFYFALLAGDALWRMRGWNPWPRFRDPQFGRDVFYGMGRGYLLCLFTFGVQQVVFLAADRSFHAFAVNDPGSSVFNLMWPALFPTMAWVAGLSEEVMFRLLGIAVLKKLLRSTVAAVLVSSIIWALAHTVYTIYPSYTRLIEVTVLGIIWSWVFLRYGLITAIFVHTSFDIIAMGLSLLTLGTPGSIALALFYVALPAIVGCVLMMLNARFKKDPAPPVPPPVRQPDPAPVPPSA